MINKWLFPFPGSNGKELTDVQAYYKALSASDDGFYPLGVNGLWHGGVHFGSGTGGSLKQDAGVRCIADGEVVAYRINKTYPEVVYPSNTGRRAVYSSGFVLVKHTLVLPPAPTPTPATPTPAPASTTPAPAPAPAAPPAEDVLVFYSLYMHTLNWPSYQLAPALVRPRFWGGISDKYLVGEKAKDKAESLAPGKTGLRIRNTANQVVGLLPRGAIIKLGAAWAGHTGFYTLQAVVSGAEGGAVPSTSPIGYVYKPELDAIREPDSAAQDNVFVLPTPVTVKAGDLLAHVGQYQRYEDMGFVAVLPANRPLLHVEVFSGADVPAFLTRSRQRAATLDAKTKNKLHIKVGTKLCDPVPSDAAIAAGTTLVEATDSPKAGMWAKATRIQATILPRTSLTAFQNGTGTNKGSYLHNGKRVQFTGRFFGATDAQVTTEKTQADSLGYTRREVLLPTGEPVWVERSALTGTAARSGWRQFPLQISKPSNMAITYSRVLTGAELDKFPASKKAIDGSTLRWWKVGPTGWICEKNHSGVEWKSSWDWPGFECVSETSRPDDQFARDLHARGGAVEAEAQNFKQKADAVDGGPLLKAVRLAIDHTGTADGVLTKQEFKKALTTQWLADRIGRLIVHYESEWGGPASKWDELDAMMGDGLPDWKAEKTRIAKLAFWSSVTGIQGFPANPEVYYFHPVGLVGNFQNSTSRITVAFLEKVFNSYGDWFSGRAGGVTFANSFRDNYPNVYKYNKQSFVELLNAALFRYEITEPYQQAHFLSQAFHESAHLDTTLEYASGNGYNPGEHSGAVANGNTAMGDGPKYKGKGLIQLTWKNNYRKYSNYRGLGEKFVNEPDLIASDMFNAIDASCWYWRFNGAVHVLHNARGDINVLIAHEKNNVTLITKAVNGGSNGLAERQELFDKIKSEWGLD